MGSAVSRNKLIMVKRELEDACGRYLSRKEEREKVYECVDRCLRKGYDYEKMKERIYDCISDEHKAHKLTSTISSIYSQFRKRARFEETKKDDRGDRKRDRKDDEEKDKKPKKVEKEVDPEREKMRQLAIELLEKKKQEEEAKRNEEVTEEQLRQKELMYKAQMEIEEAKKRLNAKLPDVTPTIRPISKETAVLKPTEASVYMNVSMSKKTRVEELKAKLAKASSALSKLPATAPGQQPLQQQQPEISGTESVMREMKARVPPPQQSSFQIVEYLDPRLKLKPSARPKRGLVFREKGEYIQLANKQRAKAKLEKLQDEISKMAKNTGISSAVKLAMVTPAGTSGADRIPEIEWWDQVVLEDAQNYDNIPDDEDPNRYAETVSELIEHPIKLQPPNESNQPHYLRVYLTKKERKKIRRQNRKEAQKEKTEKIRLGLEKAPEPKVKLSNLMKVLGTDAIQDPTKMEAHVRAQMAERQRKHERENAERKLTKEQQTAKKIKKISEDVSLGVQVTVYKVRSLAHPAKKFKVEMNAKQLHMTGVILLLKDINLVVVEGGPKQQKFYKNLMMNRMKWDEEVIGEKKAVVDKEAPGERNHCQLIWEGVAKKRAFRDFRVITMTLEKQARDLLEKHEVAHYWDLAYSTTVLLDGQTTMPEV